MLDGVVSFDLERYQDLPGTLGRRATEAAAVSAAFAAAGDPSGAAAAATLGRLESWLEVEGGRARARWETIMAIPGASGLRNWDAARGAFVLEVDWISGFDGDRHSYEELVGLVASRRYSRLLTAVAEGDELDRHEVDAMVEELAAIDEPAAAASLLNVLGAERYQLLHLALARTATDGDDPEELARVQAGMATVTGLLATASQATGRTTLRHRFLTDLVGPEEETTSSSSSADQVVDEVQARLEQLTVSVDVAEVLARGVAAGQVVEVLDGSGRALGYLSLAAPLVELVQHGPRSDEFVESTITTGLGAVALVATGPVAWAATGGAAFLSLLFAIDDGSPDEPPPLVLSPDAPNPGGSSYPYYVNEAGVPAPPNGV